MGQVHAQCRRRSTKARRLPTRGALQRERL
jgi:hypothetical protein